MTGGLMMWCHVPTTMPHQKSSSIDGGKPHPLTRQTGAIFRASWAPTPMGIGRCA